MQMKLTFSKTALLQWIPGHRHEQTGRPIAARFGRLTCSKSFQGTRFITHQRPGMEKWHETNLYCVADHHRRGDLLSGTLESFQERPYAPGIISLVRRLGAEAFVQGIKIALTTLQEGLLGLSEGVWG